MRKEKRKEDREEEEEKEREGTIEGGEGREREVQRQRSTRTIIHPKWNTQ